MFPSTLAYKYAKAFKKVTGNNISKQFLPLLEKINSGLNQNKKSLSIAKAISDQEKAARAMISFFNSTFNQSQDIALLQPLIIILARGRRLNMLDDVLQAIINIYREEHRTTPCIIRSAHQLTQEQKNTLEHFIAQKIGSRNNISYQIDKNLIAGIKIMTDFLLWEYSIEKLQRLARDVIIGDYRGY